MSNKKSNPRAYRGYRYPVPIDGYPLIDVCFKIPDHMYYRAAVRGALQNLTQFYSWYIDDPDVLQQRWDIGQTFLALLEDYLTFGDCMTEQLQVRTNPDENCVLEYSPDGGLNWFTFADVADCSANAETNYNLEINVNIQQGDIYIEQYDGTPGSINPDAPTGTWDEGGDPDREAALCMAAMAFVGSYCGRKVQQLDKEYAGIAIVLGALIVLTGGIAWPVGIALGVGLVGAYALGVARAALVDRSAQLAVACCMADGLTGQPVTEAVFASSLSSCGFTPGSNEMIVRDYVADSISNTESYLSFIDTAGRTYIQAILGIDLCECDDCGILTFDNPMSDLVYTLIYGTIGANGNPGQCVHANEWTSGGYSHGRKLEIELELPVVADINKVSWDLYHANDSFPTGQIAQTVYFYDVTHVQLGYWTRTVSTSKKVWLQQAMTGTVYSDVKHVKMYQRFVCNCPLTREIRVDNIRVFCA